MTGSLSGRKFTAEDTDDMGLKAAVKHGHWFVILDCDNMTNEEFSEVSD